MPRRRNNDFYTVEKPFTLFVFLSPESGQCFVWKTSNPNLKAVFEMHYFCTVVSTKEMFKEGKSTNTPPEMYVLQKIITTEQIAYKHCLAWAKFFVEHGFSNVNYMLPQQYIDCLDEDTLKLYEKIKDLFLFEVCPAEHRLFENYGKIRKKRDPQKQSTNISFVISPEEYRRIKSQANEIHMTPSAYAKEMTFNGEIIHEDYHFFWDREEDLRHIEQRLKGILKCIYDTGNYSPQDLTKIQQMIDSVAEIHRETLQKMSGRRKRRKRKN